MQVKLTELRVPPSYHGELMPHQVLRGIGRQAGWQDPLRQVCLLELGKKMLVGRDKALVQVCD